MLRAVSSPTRFQILAGIGRGEVCVCHLEALLDMRQAYISQQLMEMREADLLETRRDGRYIFYRLAEPQLLDSLLEIGGLFSIPTYELESLINSGPHPECCCPNCVAEIQNSLGTEAKAETN
ncbi:MAG: winged helix-turn-helix transcriptional regulator [Anaerolineales bacterium]|nr:winged helix-turn-helix transcriptional regulator [Anaerolineales bacterium]